MENHMDEYGPPEIDATEIEIFEDMLIGSGTFADVYAGRCRSLEVAVKKLKNQAQSDEELNLFREEIRLMRQLNHPNVVLYLGACTEPGKVQIVTEKMEDDLASFIHNKSNFLSLFQKLKIAKDCALGMSWLHGSQSPIIHHDLKPSNFLIDAEGRVKVSDFGLSISKAKDALIKSEVARGTAVYMAPEVFDLDDYDEKCDIYSYGIILWEITTRKLPFFEEVNNMSISELCIKVADEDLRPPLPKNCPKSLTTLMTRCWDSYADERPSFPEIVEILDEIIEEVATLDTTGRALWKRYFKNTERVHWDHFIDVFCRYFSYKYDPTDSFIRCLEILFVGSRENSQAKHVHLEQFGRILDFFGPIMENGTKVHFLDKIRNLVSQSWFYGYLNTESADARLRDQPPGYYLVRFSSSERGFFTISQVTAINSTKKKIQHTRVRHAPLSSEYFYQGRSYNSMESLIENEKEISGLQNPCPGSEFSHVIDEEIIESAYYQ